MLLEFLSALSFFNRDCQMLKVSHNPVYASLETRNEKLVVCNGYPSFVICHVLSIVCFSYATRYSCSCKTSSMHQ